MHPFFAIFSIKSHINKGILIADIVVTGKVESDSNYFRRESVFNWHTLKVPIPIFLLMFNLNSI